MCKVAQVHSMKAQGGAVVKLHSSTVAWGAGNKFDASAALPPGKQPPLPIASEPGGGGGLKSM